MLYKAKNEAGTPKYKKLDRGSNMFDYMFTELDQEGKVVFVEHQEVQEEQFTDKLTTKWGLEESALRQAIYISFVIDSDTDAFKTKKVRTGLNDSLVSSVAENSLN
jgi:hypothetical protein